MSDTLVSDAEYITARDALYAAARRFRAVHDNATYDDKDDAYQRTTELVRSILAGLSK